MIPNKKYQKSIITHFSKRKIIIRKGGYFPRRLYLAAILSSLLVVSLIMAFAFKAIMGALYLLPAILLGVAIRTFYREHIYFGETIRISKKGIHLQFSGSNSRQIEFKKDTIKSMICVVTENYYKFKLYKIDNSSLSFSVKDVNQQNPLKAILKFTNLIQKFENVQGKEKILRFWSKRSHLKKAQRPIENISDNLLEYRSPYFNIESQEPLLKINIKNHLYQSLEIDKEERTISYFDDFDEKKTLKIEEIVSIQKVVTETEALKTNNKITIRIQATLSNGRITDLLVFEKDNHSPEEMEILEINKDFENLTSIVDMSIKSAIDEDLEVLDLEELNKIQSLPLKLPSKNNNY